MAATASDSVRARTARPAELNQKLARNLTMAASGVSDVGICIEQIRKYVLKAAHLRNRCSLRQPA